MPIQIIGVLNIDFAVQGVIEILTGSADIKQYVKKLKRCDPELSSNWGTICTLVEVTAGVVCLPHLSVFAGKICDLL